MRRRTVWAVAVGKWTWKGRHHDIERLGGRCNDLCSDVCRGVAIAGLFMWGIETRQKFEWDLARRTLKAFYRERDANIRLSPAERSGHLY